MAGKEKPANYIDILDASDEDNDRNADWIKEVTVRRELQMRQQEIGETERMDSWDKTPGGEDHD